MNGSVLLIPVLWPFIGGYISYGIGRKNKKYRDSFALLRDHSFLISSIKSYIRSSL